MLQASAQTSASARIRVMVVDDSAIVRGFIARFLESQPGIEVVATCSNGEMAVREIARRACDVIILDIEMPVMDGLTALPKLLAASPGAQILMASTLTQRNAEVSLEALARGAADYIPKPSTGNLGGNEAFYRDLLAKVTALGKRKTRVAQPAAKPVASTGPAPPLRLLAPVRKRPMILAIGSSTGGPQALLTLIKNLPRNVDVPIVIAQHMPATFTTIMAQHLGRAGHRPGNEAKDGDPILPGHIYLAPGDFHFELVREGTALKARLTKEAPENFCRPSVNPLFRSAARLFGDQTAAVMLTGMGSDGLQASQDIARAGGPLIAQDEASSVVWGMPGAVAMAGLCTAVLPLNAIASHLSSLFPEARS